MSISLFTPPSTYPINTRLGSPQYGNKTSNYSPGSLSDPQPRRPGDRPISLPGIDALFSPLSTSCDGASSPEEAGGFGWISGPVGTTSSGFRSTPATPRRQSFGRGPYTATPATPGALGAGEGGGGAVSPALLPPIRHLDLPPRSSSVVELLRPSFDSGDSSGQSVQQGQGRGQGQTTNQSHRLSQSQPQGQQQRRACFIAPPRAVATPFVQSPMQESSGYMTVAPSEMSPYGRYGAGAGDYRAGTPGGGSVPGQGAGQGPGPGPGPVSRAGHGPVSGRGVGTGPVPGPAAAVNGLGSGIYGHRMGPGGQHQHIAHHMGQYGGPGAANGGYGPGTGGLSPRTGRSAMLDGNAAQRSPGAGTPIYAGRMNDGGPGGGGGGGGGGGSGGGAGGAGGGGSAAASVGLGIYGPLRGPVSPGRISPGLAHHPFAAVAGYPGTLGPYHQYALARDDGCGTRDIKRRTKTGCLTCRRRRIKCDEKRPTCANCDKAKRICLAYDPIFSRSRSRTSAGGVRKTNTGHGYIHEGRGSDGSPHGALSGGRHGTHRAERGQISPASDSSSTSASSSSHAASGSPVFSQANSSSTSAGGGGGGDADRANRMRIDSLLDAAETIEYSSFRFGGGDTGHEAATGTTPATTPPSSPATWFQVCRFYLQYVGPQLDAMFGTKRFTELVPTHPQDAAFETSGTGDGELRNYGPVEYATLEAVRQTVAELNPTLRLDDLVVDERQVAKLEDLRISNEYKLMRCVAQLLASDADTQLIETAEVDKDIYGRLVGLHRVVHGVHGMPNLGLGANAGASPITADDIAAVARHPVPSNVWSLVFRAASGAPVLSAVARDAAAIDGQLVSSLRAQQPALVVPVLLALRTAAVDAPSVRDTATRTLHSLAAALDTDVFSQRLISMALHL